MSCMLYHQFCIVVYMGSDNVIPDNTSDHNVIPDNTSDHNAIPDNDIIQEQNKFTSQGRVYNVFTVYILYTSLFTWYSKERMFI
jgi:hypothetical protein